MKNSQNNIKVAIIFFILGMLGVLAYQRINPIAISSKISVPYPSFYFSPDKTSYACKPIIGGILFGDPSKKEASADIIRESDTIAVEIQDKKAILLSESATPAIL